jgi:D-tyrosyl-tRNA(Tyr) deacylase
MRAVVQRVLKAAVRVDGRVVGEIGPGLLVFLGVAREDTRADVDYLAEKTVALRIFEDLQNKMNRSLREVGGQMLLVSQFTLLGDCRRGRRPSFVDAAEPALASTLYEAFATAVRSVGIDVQCGLFRAQMQVELINDGPVTILLDSRKLF